MLGQMHERVHGHKCPHCDLAALWCATVSLRSPTPTCSCVRRDDCLDSRCRSPVRGTSSRLSPPVFPNLLPRGNGTLEAHWRKSVGLSCLPIPWSLRKTQTHPEAYESGDDASADQRRRKVRRPDDDTLVERDSARRRITAAESRTRPVHGRTRQAVARRHVSANPSRLHVTDH